MRPLFVKTRAKGAVERLQGYLESNFEPGRRFANQLDFQLQLDAWFQKANGRTHRTLGERLLDRLARKKGSMRALPERSPEVDRRWVTRVPADPDLVGRRVEIRASQQKITAAALDMGELACSHERSFGKNRMITALEHARALGKGREDREGEMFVEQRPLGIYDRLIA